MINVDKLLEKYNLKYDDLNSVERETYYSWNEALSKGQLTLDKVRDYINTMKDAVINDLATISITKNKEKALKLQARARNYVLISNFLLTPEKIEKGIENMIAGIAAVKRA